MMENNDIGVAWNWDRRVGVLFEHVLAEPPPPTQSMMTIVSPRQWGKRKRMQEAIVDWVQRWTINTVPLRSLRRMESAYHTPIEVYTFLIEADDIEAQIEKRLNQWGLRSVRVIAFGDAYSLADYIRSTPEVLYCWVPEAVAMCIGPRAAAVDSTTELRP